MFLQDFETSIGFSDSLSQEPLIRFPSYGPHTPVVFPCSESINNELYLELDIQYTVYIHIYIYIAEESCRKLDPQNRQVGLQL